MSNINELAQIYLTREEIAQNNLLIEEINNASEEKINQALRSTTINACTKALYGLNSRALMKVLKLFDDRLVYFIIEDLKYTKITDLEIQESQQEFYENLI